MFIKEHIEFLGADAIRISNEEERTSMTIIPSAGGHLASLILDGEEVIDGFQNETELHGYAWGKSALLYPFPNRLKQGKFTFKNKLYHFPINDQNTGNALHGFGMQQNMQLENVNVSEKKGSVKLSYDYDGSLEYYPWPFQFTVEYILKPDHQFEVLLAVKNVGAEEMPFGMGWHPYFLIDKRGEKTQLELPKMFQVEIDEYMIPTGRRKEFNLFQKQKPIGDFDFDTGFALNGSGDKIEIKVWNNDHRPLTFWQESGTNQFRFLQVFIPPSRNAIALEPMTCNIDAFNNQEGLWILQPDEERSLTCGLSS